MEEQELTEKETAAIINKCPSCGATLDYDIESGNLKCSHCGTVKVIEQDSSVQRRQLTDDVLKDHDDWKESRVFRCNNCGAKGVLDKKDINQTCAFCGSSNIINTDEIAGVKPDSVIPFQITKESAVERFKKWIKSRWLAPGIFKTADIRERINGIYGSSWSFSSNTQSNYDGTLGRRVTQTRTVNGRTMVTTSIRWFRVSGDIAQSYFDYIVQSGDRIPQKMFAKIKPFDLKLLKVYRQEYLSGIIAEHYSRNLEICFGDFENYIKSDLRQKIMRRHNADTVGQLNIKTNYNDRKFNYILLPLYIANYLYNAKTYNFYINGASGTIVGKYPKSKVKLFFIGLGVAVLAAAAFFFAWKTGVFD